MNADTDARPKFMRFVRWFAWPILLGWLLLTVALNVLVPPIESVARNHAVTMSPGSCSVTSALRGLLLLASIAMTLVYHTP